MTNERASADHLLTIPSYWPHEWEAPSSVYFIGAERGPVKIGVAVNPKRRLHQIQVSSPRRLQLLATMDGAYEQERYLHDLFKTERMSGEWFRRSLRLAEFIDRLPSHWSAQFVQEMFA